MEKRFYLDKWSRLMQPQLPDTLITTLSPHLELGKSRLTTLAWLVLGLVNARTVNLSHIASQFSGPAQVSSSYRRLQRFFQYVSLDGDGLAACVIKFLGARPPWYLALDRTNWKVGRRDVNILMLAVITRRARLPLMWTVLDRAGASSSADCVALLQRYLALFGAASIRLLLCDREFIGQDWVKYLLQNNVPFAIRMRENAQVVLDDGRQYQIRSLLQKRAGASRLAARRGHLLALADATLPPIRFAAKRLADGQLLIVATNIAPDKALNAYRKRWYIECLFGDSKTRGLNMEDTRLTDPAKLNSLLVIITLAMAWAYACARSLKGRNNINKGKHGFRLKSWFRCGFDQLRKWLLHCPEKAIEAWRRNWPKRKIKLYSMRVV
jgi:hypothetical protein